MGYVNAINVYEPANLIVATLYDYWDDALGAPGLYLTTSKDFIHWTKPTLIVTVADLTANDPPGSWLYASLFLARSQRPRSEFLHDRRQSLPILCPPR